jgi:hypothetical protein
MCFKAGVTNLKMPFGVRGIVPRCSQSWSLVHWSYSFSFTGQDSDGKVPVQAGKASYETASYCALMRSDIQTQP